MSEIKLVPDENLCLVINPASKTIAPKYKRQKAIHVAKGDHDSILVAFEMPRYVNGYDMSAEENSIQIHYANISCEDTTKHSAGFDKAEDITVKDDIVSFCWRVSANATKYAGTLSIGITFERYEEIEEEVREVYSWSTAPYGKIIVCNSMDSTEEAVESAYSYLIEICDGIVTTMLQEAIDSGKLDGVSVTHHWDGTTLHVTSRSGSSSADLGGASAYELAVKHGYKGTEAQWTETLKNAIEKRYYDEIDDSVYLFNAPSAVMYYSRKRETANETYSKAPFSVALILNTVDSGDFTLLKPILQTAITESGEVYRRICRIADSYGEYACSETWSKSQSVAELSRALDAYKTQVQNSLDGIKALFPKDIGGNPIDLSTLFAFNMVGMPVSLQDILPFDTVGNPVDFKDILPYNNLGSPVDLKSILPMDANNKPVSLQTLLPFNALGKYEKVARQSDVTALKESVGELEEVAIPKIYYNTINDKDFIKSSINYESNKVSNSTYVCIYDSRTEDGTAILNNAPCKSGILFHRQITLFAIAQTMYSCDGQVYSRVLFADEGLFGNWASNEERLTGLDNRVALLEEETATKNDVEALDNKLTANILKGSASGTIVSMKDVSPIEHEMGVKARGKNLVDLNNVYKSTHADYRVEDNKLIIKKTNTAENQYTNIFFYLGKCKDFANKTLTISATNKSAVNFSIHLVKFDSDGKNVEYVRFGTFKGSATTTYTATVPDNDLDEVLCLRLVCSNTTVTGDEEFTFSNIQLEEGKVATAYAPFVADISAVKLKAYEQNLLNIDAGVNGTSFVKNSDGTYTLTKQGGNRLTGKIPFDYPNTSFSLYVEIVDTNIDGLNGISTMFKNAEETKTQYPKMTPDGKNTLIDTGGRSGLIQLYIDNAMSDGSYITFKNAQIAVSSTPITEYKPYVEPIEYSVSAEGTSKVASIHPTTTICADTDGVLIDCTYNRDINIAFKNLEEKITALSAAMI